MKWFNKKSRGSNIPGLPKEPVAADKSSDIDTEIDQNQLIEKMTIEGAFEVIQSATFIFDTKNEQIGHEFEMRVSKHHVRKTKYGKDGNLVDISHTFTDACIPRTTADFMDYMTKIKSIASQNNMHYLDDIKKQPIDLKSSVEDAKIFREYEVKKP